MKQNSVVVQFLLQRISLLLSQGLNTHSKQHVPGYYNSGCYIIISSAQTKNMLFYINFISRFIQITENAVRMN
jgi:hypothetical protein